MLSVLASKILINIFEKRDFKAFINNKILLYESSTKKFSFLWHKKSYLIILKRKIRQESPQSQFRQKKSRSIIFQLYATKSSHKYAPTVCSLIDIVFIEAKVSFLLSFSVTWLHFIIYMMDSINSFQFFQFLSKFNLSGFPGSLFWDNSEEENQKTTFFIFL